jgi:flagellar biosynthesis/type III secretory pathway M-ring protein FliF/YscJ
MRIANFSRSQRMAIVQGILCIVSIIAVMQLWLFTTTMEAYLSGEESFVLTAAAASLVCLGLNLGLFHYLRALDR